MAKRQPGVFNTFRGLWARGTADDCPLDHSTDCQNLAFIGNGFQKRDGTEFYKTGVAVRMQLYKPLPPFSGSNIPRVIFLKNDGTLIDTAFPGSPIYFNANAKDFSLANFYGRAYISVSDGKVGLSGVNLKVYDGTGVAGFRDAAGPVPGSPLVGVAAAGGTIDVGTYLISYAFETASGFITKPAVPFVGFDSFGSYKFTITTLPTGPAGTVARHVIVTKAFPLATIGPLGGPYNVGIAEFTPLFFHSRIGDNVTTTAVINFFDEQLVESADYLFTNLSAIPAGVGLLDYNARLVTYGENTTPSIVRVSRAGEPEVFSSTSGFLTTDPSDSTGVRSATEFRKTLYFFKRERGYVTQDNGQEASTWEVVNFEKSIGTEQYGIAAVTDAKGSSSEGFLVASLGAVYFFNGVFQEPELSFKIRDYWDRINKTYFHLVQAAIDPVKKRIFILIPLDEATKVTHLLVGDYRDGLNAQAIKWCPWVFPTNFGSTISSVLVFTDFTSNIPTNFTIFSNGADDMVKLSKGILTDSILATPITAFSELAPTRFGNGLSEFSRVRVRATGPCTMKFIAYGEDKVVNTVPANLVIPNGIPGREYEQIMNLLNEQCRLKITVDGATDVLDVKSIILKGRHLYNERPR